MNEFTKGEVRAYNHSPTMICVGPKERTINCGGWQDNRGDAEAYEREKLANAALVAAAFTAATKLDAMGYDVMAVFAKLHIIVKTFMHLAPKYAQPYTDLETFLSHLHPEAHHDEG